MSCATVNQALEWLEKNQDKPLDELLADAKADEEDEEVSKINVDSPEEGGGAASLVCNDCGKLFRNADLASYHASKTYVYSPQRINGAYDPGRVREANGLAPVNTPTSPSRPRRSPR